MTVNDRHLPKAMHSEGTLLPLSRRWPKDLRPASLDKAAWFGRMKNLIARSGLVKSGSGRVECGSLR